MVNSWKPEVIADSSGKFYGNALRFATQAEAEANARDLANRWFAVTAWRATESEDMPNYSYEGGQLAALPEPVTDPLEGMTQAEWNKASPAEREKLASTAGLIPELIGLEGWRVVATYPDGETSRFYVGRSSGWRPCHIELKRRDSNGGCGVTWPAGTTFRKLYRKR